MLLSCRFLIDVNGVNSFEHTDRVELYAGDTQTLYFQLINASLDRPEQGFSPAGRRYMPPAASSLSVQLINIDDARKITRAASQPFPQDPSIWSIPLLSSDPLKGTVTVKMTLTEPGRVLHANFPTGILLRVR